MDKPLIIQYLRFLHIVHRHSEFCVIIKTAASDVCNFGLMRLQFTIQLINHTFKTLSLIHTR